MTKYRFHTADVFTEEIFGGNPLAVFPEAEGLDAARMQRVAAEFNLSETVFVLPAEDPAHDFRLRIFTPGTELPFAGHPTVGAALVLAWTGRLKPGGETTRLVFEEAIGPVPVSLSWRDGRAVRAQLTAAARPEEGPAPPPADELAALLGLEPADILVETGPEGYRPRAVSCGVPFTIVPLRDKAALARAALDQARWQALLSGKWAPQLYLVTRDAGSAEANLRARMFAPAMGIAEDPATGAAASALAGYLAATLPSAEGTLAWRVEQGVEMGRPSLIEIEADKSGGTVTAVRVSGSAVPVSEGEMRIPEPA